MEFPDLLERFISYAKVDTGSDPDSETFPSTEKQFDLAEKLVSELCDMGLSDAGVNEHGYVTGFLETNQDRKMPVIALIAHMDTSPDVNIVIRIIPITCRSITVPHTESCVNIL